MPEFSNVVRQRLASGERVRVHTSHPDADTLTAYAEQLLTARERSEILAHLCMCSECREVVALSLPELEVATRAALAAAPAAGQRRFAWTWKWRASFGLAASVAAVAVVTLVIIEAPHKSGSPVVNSANQTAAAVPATSTPATSADQNSPAPLQPERANANESAKAASPGAVSGSFASSAPMTAPAPRESWREQDSVGRAMATSPPVAPVVTVSAGSVLVTRMDRQDYKNQTMFEEARRAEPRAEALNDLPAAPAPQGNQLQTSLFATNNSVSVPTSFSGLNQNPPSTTVRITSPTSGSRRVVTMVGGEIKDLFSLKRYTPAISGKSGFLGSAMGGPQFNPAKDKDKDQSVEVAAASPTLDKEKTAAGALGQTSAFTTGARADTGYAYSPDAREKKELTPAWKVADGKLWKSGDSATWVEGYSGAEGIAFSVVSARGLEVWAGGAGASLVHSRDGGATWERIILGASATGTITGIENGHSIVRVKSSSGQSWSSADGGKSWNLQD